MASSYTKGWLTLYYTLVKTMQSIALTHLALAEAEDEV